MAKSPLQRTRLQKVVTVVNDFMDGQPSSTGTRKYRMWSNTYEELYSGETCIALWQWRDTPKGRILISKSKVSRTAGKCIGVLRMIALHRKIPYIYV